MKKYPLISVDFDDYTKQATLKMISDILDSGILTNFADYCVKIEEQFSNYLGCDVISVSNATIGLMIVYEALLNDAKKRKVLLPSFTFNATASALLRNNLVPVFCDIDINTFNISPQSIRENMNDDIAAIVGVHAFGNPCEIDEILSIGEEFDIPVIFDAAQAMGAIYKGKYVGNFGNAEVFSCNATKLLTMGEGGFITFGNNKELKQKLTSMRYFGMGEDYETDFIGTNGKLQELNAALGLALLPKLESKINKLNILADRYEDNLEYLKFIKFQQIEQSSRSVRSLFSFLVDHDLCGVTSSDLVMKLSEKGIDSRKYFRPLHKTNFYKSFVNEKTLPVTENVYSKIISLPLYEKMSVNDVDYICEIFTECLK